MALSVTGIENEQIDYTRPKGGHGDEAWLRRPSGSMVTDHRFPSVALHLPTAEFWQPRRGSRPLVQIISHRLTVARGWIRRGALPSFIHSAFPTIIRWIDGSLHARPGLMKENATHGIADRKTDLDWAQGCLGGPICAIESKWRHTKWAASAVGEGKSETFPRQFCCVFLQHRPPADPRLTNRQRRLPIRSISNMASIPNPAERSGDADIHGKIQELSAEIRLHCEPFNRLLSSVSEVVVGQQKLIQRMLVGLLANGHLLIEGVPGLAKTTAVACMAQGIHTQFQRIQFTPDLLPADLIGTLVYRPQNQEFVVQKGPIFSNLILADEINRAPAKVQSALLEAMQERQVTIGSDTFALDEPFLVMATQNPIEQEGTYPLPEAQMDRFLLKVVVDYPDREHELMILDRMTGTRQKIEIEPVMQPQHIETARDLVDQIYIDQKIREYIVDLVMATRQPERLGIPVAEYISYGVSPRATIGLTLAAKANAFLQGRGYVVPQDVKEMATDVLRHRLMITYEAEAEDRTSDDIVKTIVDHVPVP